MFSNAYKHVFKLKSALMGDLTKRLAEVQLTQTQSVIYRSNELWKSVMMVSSQGSKKGRNKRRGASRPKDLNLGQTLGDGKMKMQWPGLNIDSLSRETSFEIKVIGVDEDREKRLTELRDKMDRFKRITVPPSERGFTGSNIRGKKFGAPDSYDDVDFTGFESRIISYRTIVSHKSKLGKKKIASCFVITGNGKGIIGFGNAKAGNSGGALRQAKLRASKNLLYFDLYENRTLFHDFYEEFYFTKIFAEKKPDGYGLVCHRILKVLCQLIGIKDVYAKVEGSRNGMNMVKAFVSGLLNQKRYVDIANENNMYVVELKPENNFFPTLLGAPGNEKINPLLSKKSKTKRNKIDEQIDEIMNDLNFNLMENRSQLEKKKKKPFYYDYPTYKKYCKLRDKHEALKRARIQRIKLLQENILMENKYPLKPSKKEPKAEGAE